MPYVSNKIIALNFRPIDPGYYTATHSPVNSDSVNDFPKVHQTRAAKRRSMSVGKVPSREVPQNNPFQPIGLGLQGDVPSPKVVVPYWTDIQRKPAEESGVPSFTWHEFQENPLNLLRNSESYVYVPLDGNFVSINIQVSNPEGSLGEKLPSKIQQRTPSLKLECAVFSSKGDTRIICVFYIYEKQLTAYITNVHRQEDAQLYTDEEVELGESLLWFKYNAFFRAFFKELRD